MVDWFGMDVTTASDTACQSVCTGKNAVGIKSMTKSKTTPAMAATDFILDQYEGDTLSKEAEARIRATEKALKKDVAK